MKYLLIILVILCPLFAHPPGGPLGEYDGAKMAMGFYFDHSGQDLFKSNLAPSVLNSTGAQITYAPIKYMHFGGYIGAAEFDHLPPESSSEASFNSDYSFTWGGNGKLFTPRFLSNTTCLFASGSAGLIKAEDEYENKRELWEYHTVLGIQYRPVQAFNLGVGCEVFFLDGTQSNADISDIVFGNSDNFRGLLSVEFYPKTNQDLIQGQPFIGLAFRFTGATGWEEELGLKNSSLSFSIGIITDYLYGKKQTG